MPSEGASGNQTPGRIPLCYMHEAMRTINRSPCAQAPQTQVLFAAFADAHVLYRTKQHPDAPRSHAMRPFFALNPPLSLSLVAHRPPLPPSPPPDAPTAMLEAPPSPVMPGGDNPEVVGDFSQVGIGNIVAVGGVGCLLFLLAGLLA